MGQSVSNLPSNHGKDKKTRKLAMNLSGYKSDDDDELYLSSRSVFEHDTGELNTSNFEFSDPEDLPTYAKRTCNSSSKQDYRTPKRHVAEIASKRIPQSAWSGHHLLKMSKTKRMTSRLFLNESNAKLDVKATENNNATHTNTEISLENETGSVPENNPEIDQLITLMKNHRVSDHTANSQLLDDDVDDSQSLASLSTPTEESNKVAYDIQIKQNNLTWQMNLDPQQRTKNSQTFDFHQGSLNEEEQVLKDDADSDSNTSPGQRKILPLKRRWKKKLEMNRLAQSEQLLSPPNNQQDSPSEGTLYVKTDNSSRLFSYTDEAEKSSPMHSTTPIYDQYTKYAKDTTNETGSAKAVMAAKKIAEEKEKADSVTAAAPVLKESPFNFEFSPPKNSQSLVNKEVVKDLKSAILTANNEYEAIIESTRIIREKRLRYTANLSQKSKQFQASVSTKSTQKPLPSTTTTTTTTTTTNTTAITKPAAKKRPNKKRKNEMSAPGGFLSSDITLFENPIDPDEFICLFCQYDILTYGLKDAKKMNGYYRRRKEKMKKVKELITEEEEQPRCT